MFFTFYEMRSFFMLSLAVTLHSAVVLLYLSDTC